MQAVVPQPLVPRRCSMQMNQQILENLVPNPTAISDLSAQHINPRTGRKARRRTLPSDAPARIKTLLSTSLPHIGPKLFNNLPGKLRNLAECSVEKFKHHLDNHLQTIPDEPPVPGYTSVSRADTNSISDQVNQHHRDAGFGCSGGAPRLSFYGPLWLAPYPWPRRYGAGAVIVDENCAFALQQPTPSHCLGRPMYLFWGWQDGGWWLTSVSRPQLAQIRNPCYIDQWSGEPPRRSARVALRRSGDSDWRSAMRWQWWRGQCSPLTS
ncbi:hypothetical protein GWK47_034138 [Chionoecetes opilio]|uniref:Uncharacterized protein n=1 Tax=Chionoecetes opilio TaxID=41210 RepID=A0A8J5D3Q7_CHIOP|nr:hypothetical protein GWK47_034138 [Chionoecetes opilio]